MHQALYRKWRPKTFSEVCGQEHITSILKYETEQHKFSHAYLFCGSRGTGKTTCAKILAKAVNCESPVDGGPCNECASCRAIDAGIATDVLEMDAASNNGVDNIRDIRDEVMYSPSALRYRVYIVDEVHMLSGSAFNALLKTLEEPPAHVVFILATTELHKLPSTIVSRCQRFDFRRIATDVLTARLSHIADREGIEYETDALRILAKLAQGGMRDAISLLELCAGTRQKITPTLVDRTVGSGGRELLEQTVRAIAASNFDGIFSTVDEVVRSSRDVAVFWQELESYYRDMLVMRASSLASRYLDLTENESARLKKTADLFSKETILHHCKIMDEALYAMQRAGAAKRLIAEMALLRMCDASLDGSADAILSRLSKLEAAVASGLTYRPAEMQRAEKAVSAAETAEKKNPEKQEPTRVEEKAREEKKPEPPASAEPTYRLIRGWNEIAEQATAGDSAVLAFAKMAKAVLSSDGRVYIKFPSDFARSVVDRPAVREAIRASLCLSLSRTLSEKDLILDVMESEEIYNDLDELELT